MASNLLSEPLPTKRVALHATVGAADQTIGALGRSRKGLRHLSPKLCRECLVEPPKICSIAVCSTKVTRSFGGGLRAVRALSAGEVGQGYREVADPSVFVKFPLIDHPQQSLLVWTTTPWTLPSNMFAAVHPELEYSLVTPNADEGVEQNAAAEADQLWIASALVETIAAKTKREFSVLETCQGNDLVGLQYEPPFDYFYKDHSKSAGELVAGGQQTHYWRVVAADFVTTESGTGLVHQAPAFGEVDYDVLATEQQRFVEGQQPDLLYCVGPDGKFTDVAGPFADMWVKDADKPISRDLRERGRLFLLEQYLHDYPFCWRRSRPAHPIPARKLVRSHDPIQGPDAGKQCQDRLAARTHSRRSIWKLSCVERRLGALA